MTRPPLDPRTDGLDAEPSWRSVLSSYVAVAALALSLWAVANPLAGAVALATVAGSIVAARGALRLRRCVRECGGFAVDLGRVRIYVGRAGEPHPARRRC